jgi:hypothetical protein
MTHSCSTTSSSQTFQRVLEGGSQAAAARGPTVSPKQKQNRSQRLGRSQAPGHKRARPSALILPWTLAAGMGHIALYQRIGTSNSLAPGKRSRDQRSSRYSSLDYGLQSSSDWQVSGKLLFANTKYCRSRVRVWRYASKDLHSIYACS